MALRASTGYSSLILGPYAFETIFHQGSIEVYTGAQPAHGNLAPTGTYLGRVTLGGLPWAVGDTANGLVFQRGGPYVFKPLPAQWVLSVTATGNAGWWRLVSAADTGGPSYDFPRLDGAISSIPGAAEWIVPNNGMLVGTQIPLDNFTITLPPLPE